jgi:DNA-binding CsgD family transcriptional regulator
MNMGILSILRRWKVHKPKRRQHASQSSRLTLVATLQGIEARFLELTGALAKLDCEVIQQGQILMQQVKRIDSHEQSIGRLEDLVTSRPNAMARRTDHPQPPSPLPDPSPSRAPPASESARFDLDRFSDQEKRILTVFLNHQDMPLSYRDIAAALGRAPNTVKNQINALRARSDLFDISTGEMSRNRFRLKQGLTVGSYLSLGQATGPTQSTAESDESAKAAQSVV